MPEGPRMFLYIFDVSSQTERKNPLAAIRAFRRAGLPHDDAVLVLKFTNPEYDRAGVRRLHEEVGGLERRLARRISRSAGALRARQLPPTAICRRTAPKDSA